MREAKLALALENLGVESFTTGTGGPEDGVGAQSYYQHTVLYHTEQVSCYNTDCGTCGGTDCWA
jgi:hypothetical protein